ncbi:MAG: hypothetical protein PVF10_08120 [Syntrophobacterales bacterium]
MTRVLHLPTPVGGMPWGLAQGERSLGLNSQVLYTYTNWLDYPNDICLNLERVNSRLVKLKKLSSTFFAIRDKFDVFHFNFGQSLINTEKLGMIQVEIPFYPQKAKLFVTYNGCDARQKYPTVARREISACHSHDCFDGVCNSGKRDRMRRKGIAKMAKYVRHMWAVNPDLLHFLPKEKASFLPYAVILDKSSPKKPTFDKKKLKVVHAATDRAAKGSDIIIAAMEQVKKTAASKVEFQVIENLPHQQATKVYREADLIIDQVLVGWYGGIAVEVMSMGKPVICRIEEEDLHFIPKQMAADLKDAFIQGEETNLKEVILRCIEDREFLQRKSEAGLDYARTWHDPKYVAGITKEAYESS